MKFDTGRRGSALTRCYWRSLLLAIVTMLAFVTPVLAAGSISGTITDSGTGAAINGITVMVFGAVDGVVYGYEVTDSAGSYTANQLAPGNYQVRAEGQGYIKQWYSGKSSTNSADIVAVVDANTTGGINFSMAMGGSITGTVADKDTGALLSGQLVYLFDAADSWVGAELTDSTGTYTISALAPGNYRAGFEGSSGYISQWYDGATELAGATPIAVSGTNTVSGINGALRKGGSISGRVTDSLSGLPVAGVTLTVSDWVTGSWIDSTSTDSSGGYTIGALDGNYKLRFTGAGYIQKYFSAGGGTAATAVAVAAPTDITGFDLTMVKGGSVSGTVTDSATGVGIPDVMVSVYDADGYGSDSYTDSTGAYTVSGLATGNYSIQFSSEAYISQWYGDGAPVAVTAPVTTSGIDMALAKGGFITGRVTASETGSPVSGVYVTVYDAAGGAINYSFTNNSGVYSVGQLPSGRYKLHFSADSDSGLIDQWYSKKDVVALADTIEVVAPNTVGNIDVILEKGAVITGVVKDGTSGALLAGVSVVAYSAVDGSFIGSATTNSSGNYSIAGLLSGSYVLSYGSTNYIRQWYEGKRDRASATAVAVTAPSTASGINVSLLKGGSISGKLTDSVSGAGIADVYISVTDRFTGDWGGNTYTDQDGNYTINGLASSSYSLYMEPADDSGYSNSWYGGTIGGLCAGAIPVTAPDATTGVDIQLTKGASVSGRMTDGGTGLGISGGRIYLRRLIDGAPSGSTASSRADTTGAYQVSGLLTGEYAVYFRAKGYVNLEVAGTISVVAPNVLTGVDGALTKGGEIRGRVTDSGTGAGVGGVVIEAYDIDKAAWGGSSNSDSDGSYTISGLSSGRYQLYSDGSNAPGSYGFSSVPLAEPLLVTAPAVVTGVDFTIDYLGSISGTISDSAGKALPNISVAVYDSVGGYMAGSGYTDANGAYTVGGLPTGSYRVMLGYSGGAYISTWYGGGTASALAPEVAVQAPQNTSGINGRLIKAGSITGSISAEGCLTGQITIGAYDVESGDMIGQAWVSLDRQGTFTIQGLPTGSYKLAIEPGNTGFGRQWYPNKNDMASAESIAVTAGSVTEGIRVRLISGGGSISGEVLASSRCGVVLSTVKLFDWSTGGLANSTLAFSGGSYGFAGLADGTYKISFSVDGVTRWYGGSGSTQAAPLVISGSNALTGIDLALACSPDGDFDGNGDVDLLDALKALRIAVGQGTATAENLLHGDLAPMVNGVSVPDGVIDIADALLILRKVVAGPQYHY